MDYNTFLYSDNSVYYLKNFFSLNLYMFSFYSLIYSLDILVPKQTKQEKKMDKISFILIN